MRSRLEPFHRTVLCGLHQWARESFSLRVHHLDAPDRSPLRLRPPLLHYHADPFVIEREGRVQVFFEDFDALAGRGRIATLRLDGHDGPHRSRIVLDAPHHLSYPFLFEEEGRLYMVPESSQARSVDLYRCIDFPHAWILERRLLADIDAADTNLLRHDGRVWLVTSVRDARSLPGRRHLCIFSASDLRCDALAAHPVNEARLHGDLPNSSGRNAGGWIRHQGRLLRPAQHNPHHYGEDVRFHEITRLDGTGFEEVRLDVAALPPELAALSGIHHVSRQGSYLVTDARDRVGWLDLGRRTLPARDDPSSAPPG